MKNNFKSFAELAAHMGVKAKEGKERRMNCRKCGCKMERLPETNLCRCTNDACGQVIMTRKVG